MEEVWKNIEGYEGLYQVSNLGRVKSLPKNTTNGKILRPTINTQGYFIVVLYKDDKKKYYKVHRLVAQAFIPNDETEHKTQVNHKDECKTNNRVDNLEWMTPKENTNWGTGIERRSKKQLNHPNESKPVKQLSLDGTLVAIWPSMMEAQRNGFNQGNVSSCCRGELKQYKGYKWEYAS